MDVLKIFGLFMKAIDIKRINDPNKGRAPCSGPFFAAKPRVPALRIFKASALGATQTSGVLKKLGDFWENEITN